MKIYEIETNNKVLQKIADMINRRKPALPFDTESVAKVDHIWFDEGQHLMWHTIVVGKGFDSWQLLSPRVNKLLLKLSPEASNNYIEALVNLIIKQVQENSADELRSDYAAMEYIIDAANNEVNAKKLMNK